jgi:undecaprenyl-diphosphatase
MIRPRTFGLASGVVAALLVGGALTSPYVPGDVELARALQAISPDPGWAELVTRTAAAPWSYGLVGAAALVAWGLAGWRAACAAAIAFFSLWWFGDLLKPLIGRPRPDASLVHVYGAPEGFAFPSTLGMAYGSTFGLLLALALTRIDGPERRIVVLVALMGLLTGIAARVVPGAHWPSDVLGAYAIACTWNAVLIAWLLPVRSSRAMSAAALVRLETS